jgi:hypothetical protein
MGRPPAKELCRMSRAGDFVCGIVLSPRDTASQRIESSFLYRFDQSHEIGFDLIQT